MLDLELRKSQKLTQLKCICEGCNQPVDKTEILDYLNGVNNPDLEPLVISEPT
jgi:5-methylcytosine-specific restriction endonuclease McrA